MRALSQRDLGVIAEAAKLLTAILAQEAQSPQPTIGKTQLEDLEQRLLRTIKTMGGKDVLDGILKGRFRQVQRPEYQLALDNLKKRGLIYNAKGKKGSTVWNLAMSSRR